MITRVRKPGTLRAADLFTHAEFFKWKRIVTVLDSAQVWMLMSNDLWSRR